MAKYYDGQSIGFNAGEDLSSARHRFIVIESGTGDAVLPSSQGDDAVGVTTDNPGSGETASIQIDGAPKVEAGESITRDDDVTTDANGKAITATGGDQILGKAKDNAGGDGNFLPVILDKNGTA